MDIRFWLFTRTEEGRKLLNFSKNIVVANYDGQVRVNAVECFKNTAKVNGHNMFTDAFITAEHLYDGSDNFIISHLSDLSKKNSSDYPINIYDLRTKLLSTKYPINSRTYHYKESVLNRLGGLLSGKLKDFLMCRKGHFETLVKNNVVFEIKDIKFNERIMVVNWLTLGLYNYKLNHPDTNIFHVIAFDDAKPLFHKNFEKRTDGKQPPIEDFIDTARKANIQIIICAQSLGTIMKCAIDETATKIMMNTVDNDDVKNMLRVMGINDKNIPELKEYCSGADNRKAVIFMSRRNIPAFVLKIDEVEIPTKTYSDEEIKENNARLLGLPESETNDKEETIQQSIDSEQDKETAQQTVSDNEKKFLFAVNIHQYSASFGELAELPDLSRQKISRYSDSMYKKGLIEIIDIWRGNKRYKYPVLKEKGYETIGLKQEKPGTKGGKPEHVLFQHLISSRFEGIADNIKVEREMHINDIYLDVGIKYPDLLLGIEVAITSGNELNNLKNDFARAGCDYIIVVCKNKEIASEVNQLLEKLDTENRRHTKVCLLDDILNCNNPRDLLEPLNMPNKPKPEEKNA